MLIGELAKAVGVSTQALRFYERLGLIEPSGRSPCGYRHYDSGAVIAVRRIKAAQALGFTLAEIRRIVEANGGTPGPAAIRAIAGRKRAQIRGRISELQRIDETIAGLIDACGCDRDGPCSF